MQISHKFHKNFTKIVKTFNILKYCYHIWVHREKCIQISTNMPSVCSVNPEIGFEILKLFPKQKT